MEITSHSVEGTTDVRVKGRVDGYWADHLSQALEETVRAGHHQVRLNMAEVTYLSSLGIRVLVSFHKKLEAISGSFTVADASPVVKRVLDMVGLGGELMGAPAAAKQPRTEVAPSRTLERNAVLYEIYDLPQSSVGCKLHGDPSLLEQCGFGEKDSIRVAMPETSFGFGLGAFGHSYSECRGRYGEFLAVAGAAAYQPTDGSNVPDFQLAEGAFVPEMEVLYGALCSGAPSMLARFETKLEHDVIGLADVAKAALEISGAEQAGVICVAESAGLVGATLRKPPVEGGSGTSLFAHPEIRNWLSFTTERAYADALTVVVGIVAKSASGAAGPLLRPLNKDGGGVGHFHAAAFSYRPLPRGRIDLNQTVKSLFAQETLLGILHLIGDDRDATGVAESEFVRGACWIAPVGSGAA